MTAQDSSTPIVEVESLTKHFPATRGARVHAVEQVSLHIDRGETLAVVGESGCGKSTLAYLIIRLLNPTSGTIRLDGTDITSLGPKALRPHRRKAQIVFQDPFASLDPRRAIGKAIAEPLEIHHAVPRREINDIVADLLRRVGMSPDDMAQYPHQFSGGQRQRICIARALALRPELVIADEAVSALDVSIQAQVINLMMDLQSEMGLSYLFISHDLAVVERIAHRVGVMYLGQIVELGPRRAIFENPAHPYTQRLLDAVPIADPARRRTDRPVLTDEVPSPVFEAGTAPEPVELVEIEPDHYVAQATEVEHGVAQATEVEHGVAQEAHD
ncbi:ABC transporter ATP-binding protein [Candidatus Poriferisodalis sp.]|uniref:ABC transporter ATP-binding protein n=1 Tax=Candidatus Poriferisodalis sp. TaxID=3101277 RepID=UPI003AF833C1